MGKSAGRSSLDAIVALAEELDSEAYPEGGTVAASVAALAASLVAAVADRSRTRWTEAGGARAQAQALRRRVVELAARESSTYAAAREALERRGDEPGGSAREDQAGRDWRLANAVERAAGPPLELAASAADIAELAALVAVHGAADLRADAVIAATLAAAAARGAAELVQINLVVGEQQPAVLARGYAAAAAAASSAAERG